MVPCGPVRTVAASRQVFRPKCIMTEKNALVMGIKMKRARNRTVEQRFWDMVNKTETCWLWTGFISPDGYGRFNDGTDDRHNQCSHRWIYNHLKGEIEEGLEIDHLCRNRACVNPGHLEAVTHHENLMRGDSPPARHARKTHCIHGHALTPENILAGQGPNCRKCRVCKNIRQREMRRRVNHA